MGARARIGEWGPAPRVRGTRFRVVAAPTGAPTESGQVRGRDACAPPQLRDALTRGLVIRGWGLAIGEWGVGSGG